MKELIQKYIAERKLAWSPSTLRSESSRLNAIAAHLDGNPDKLWLALQDRGAYTRTTTWTRVVDFWQWCLAAGHMDGGNKYAEFRKRNARLFKNSYQRQVPSIDYRGAKERILNIGDPTIRAKALELLGTGMRYTESLTFKDGLVVGKGGKPRRVYGGTAGQGSIYTGTYITVWRALRRVGLKPHDLRKLCFNRLVELGANEFELCAAAGWSSLNTASSYIKANNGKLENLFRKVSDE